MESLRDVYSRRGTADSYGHRICDSNLVYCGDRCTNPYSDEHEGPHGDPAAHILAHAVANSHSRADFYASGATDCYGGPNEDRGSSAQSEAAPELDGICNPD